MTFKKILNDGVLSLKKNRIADPEFDAREILLYMLDIDLASFLYICENDLELNYNKSDISNIINQYDRLISYRSQHFPLQYILGESYFCGLKFNIKEGVLIPRFDTECLVEKVLNDNSDKNKTILDLCTGSGCIAISLAKLGGYKVVVGSDISDDAISLASENANELLDNNDFDDELNQKIYFVKSNMFEDLNKLKKVGIEKFDIITSNPPYIKTNEINNLDIEVRQFEPIIALDGDFDGLKYYKNISSNSKQFLNDNGKIYLEIGYDQKDDVCKLFENDGYNVLDVVKDLAGNNRVVVLSL